MSNEDRKDFERTTLTNANTTDQRGVSFSSNEADQPLPLFNPERQPSENFDDLFSDVESQYDPDDDLSLSETDEEFAADAVFDITHESAKKYNEIAQSEVSQHKAEKSPRPRTTPLITSEVLANVSTHNFPEKLSTTETPTLKYHFVSEEGVQRKHRHTKPRSVKFVYDDPTIQFEEEQAAQAEHEAALQAATKAAAKGGHKGMR